jgi:hypothetical protein
MKTRITRVRISDLQDKAKERGPDYMADFLSKGTVDGNVLTLPSKDYIELVKKYNPSELNPPVQSNCSSCGTSPPPQQSRKITRPISSSLAASIIAASMVSSSMDTASYVRPTMPPLHKQIRNAAGAAGRIINNAIRGRQLTVSEEVKQERLEPIS